MTILVTGGAGYIGSHTVQALLAAGMPVVVYDNLSTGHRGAVPMDVPFVEGDIHDQVLVAQTCLAHQVQGAIHFAAASLVGESMTDPAKYYGNNVAGTLSLLQGLRAGGVDKLVFSSTAAVYGEPEAWPIQEAQATCPTNVYGRTKLLIEGMLQDFDQAYGTRYVSLRYFNAAGAAVGGCIGEDHAPETHLIPLVLKTALGLREEVQIYGTDYATTDGTCIRDYIHVDDLAAAHVLAVQHLLRGGASRIYNLGSETGFSVRQVIDTAREVTGQTIRTVESARRAGDPTILVASSAKIRQELGWEPKKSDLREIVATAWAWHESHPQGYED